MQRLAWRVGVPEDRLEQFIRESPWEFDTLQHHLVKNMPDTIRSPSAALVIDDVGLKKQGKHSVGVARQYSGALGKIGNCQVAVDLVYAVPDERRNADQVTWPLGMRLYVPDEWANDRRRRREVEIPDEVEFQTKIEIAMDMLQAAFDAGLPHRCVLADAGYGDSGEFRAFLRERGEAYALGITPSSIRVMSASIPLVETGPSDQGKGGRPRTRVTYPEGTLVESPVEVAARVKRWHHVNWAIGTKGPMWGKFYAEKVRLVSNQHGRWPSEEVAWLLLEKRPTQSGGEELKAYLCWGLDDATLETLVEYAHLRWVIEQFHREAKQVLGLDRFEGRSWRGWHHHITMVLLAHAFIATIRAENTSGRAPRASFQTVVRAVVLEAATQLLIREHRLPRPKAAGIATDMLRGFSDWLGKPRK